VRAANDFAAALETVLEQHLAAGQRGASQAAARQVADLEQQVDALNVQIAAAQHPAPAVGGSRPATPGVAPTGAGATESTSPAASGSPAVTTTTSGSDASAVDPTVGDLQAQEKALAQLYGAALRKEQGLAGASAAGSGVVVVRAARQAARVTAAVSPLDSRRLRGVVGLSAGLVVGVGVALLLGALERRLWSRRGAMEAFGVPVVAEIPRARHLVRRPRRSAEAGEALDLVGRPLSAGAEAYRMLHAAVVVEPLAIEPPSGRHRRTMVPLGSADTASNFFGGWSTWPSGSGQRSTRRPRHGAGDDRQVVLVVSCGPACTRGVVVRNLAAAYAESGLPPWW